MDGDSYLRHPDEPKRITGPIMPLRKAILFAYGLIRLPKGNPKRITGRSNDE